MDQDSAHMVATSKVPMLKPENGNAPPITKVVEGIETIIAPTTAEEKAQRRFGGNATTKKTQKNILKQQYENFIASSSEVLDQTFDRLQKLISQLEIHGESILQEDVNQKFLRSLSPEWNTHTIVWRNKPEIDTLSLDDLYINLKIYEPEVKGTSSSINTALGAITASTQAIVVNSTTIDNLSDVIICAFFASQPNSPQLDRCNPQIDLQDQGVIDSGCSRHMTGNMSYLTDYKEKYGGYVAFGGNPKEGKITGKGTKACDDAGKARMETVPGKDYILLPFWNADLPFSQSLKSYPDAGFKPSGDDVKKVTEELGKEGGDSNKDSESNDQEKEDNVNSTNTVNATSTNEVNVVGVKTSIELPNDPNMPELEDIVYSCDDEDVGAEADMNNLDAFMPVSPTLTTRIHKDS
ncbi:hypothetical protein Tco_1507531 [Tanacetum coccineum]